jgi:hypothetical protein
MGGEVAELVRGTALRTVKSGRQGDFEVGMEDRGGTERGPLAELASHAAGDVVAARAVAEKLLWTRDPKSSLLFHARLIMTAACLQLQCRSDRAPSISDLLDLLTSIDLGIGLQSLLSDSPMQFLQFVAAELDALEPGFRKEVLDLCKSACLGSVP